MQNFPHLCLNVLAVQSEERVFFSGDKEDILSSNFLTSHPGEGVCRDYASSYSKFQSKVTSSRYDYSFSWSYKNQFLNVSLLYLAILMPPSAFQNFPKPGALDSHQASLGQQHHLLATIENSWTQHPSVPSEMIIHMSLKFPALAGSFSHAKLLTFVHPTKLSHTPPDLCILFSFYNLL